MSVRGAADPSAAASLARTLRAFMSKVGAPVAIALLLGVVGFLVAYSDKSATPLAVLLALVVMSAAFLAPIRVVVVMLVLAAFLLPWPSSDLGLIPPAASVLVDLLIVVVIVRAIGKPASKQTIIWLWPVMVLLTVLTLSAFTAIVARPGDAASIIVAGVRRHMRFPLLGLGLTLIGLDERDWRLIFRTLMAVLVIQLPVTLVQWFTVGPGDPAGGTLANGGTGILAMFLATMLLAFAYGQRKVPGRTGTLLLVAGLAIAPSAIGGAVAMVPMLVAGAAVLVFVTLGAGHRSTWTSAALLVVVAIGIVGFMSASDRIGYQSARTLSSVQSILNYDKGTTRLGRLSRYDQVTAALALNAVQTPVERPLGYGLGAVSASGLGSGFEGRLRTQTPVLRFIETSATISLIETGWAGLFAMLLCIGIAGKRAASLLRRIPETDLLGARWAAALLVAGVVSAITMLYSDPWYQPGFALIFWLAFAACGNWVQRQGELA